MKGFSKKEKELMGMDNSVVIEGVGWVKVEEDKREINGNGKNIIKNKQTNTNI